MRFDIFSTIAQHFKDRKRQQEQPAEQGPITPAPIKPSHFPFEEISELLVDSMDPIGDLKLLVGDIRTRQAAADSNMLEQGMLPPSDVERYFAQSLEEAGLFSNDVEMPRLRIVQPRRSKMFYLRIEDFELSYLAKQRVIQIEAALNRIHFAHIYFDDLDVVSEEELYQLNQNLTKSIAAQLPSLLEQLDMGETLGQGEWAARSAISTGIESFQLPYRFTAQFRLNLSGGKAAFHLDLTPAEVFPLSCYSEELGRIIPTTATMREQMASDYALRLGILVATHTFWCSEQIEEVWLAGMLDKASSHSCLYSVCFKRDDVAWLELQELADPAELYRASGATMQLENDVLQPVAQSFSLEDEAFCPSRRYDNPELSDRMLSVTEAAALGAQFVRDIAINEEVRREQVAADIARQLSNSTEKNVKTIMELAGNDPDPSVQNAATRTIERLIEGSMPELDAYEFESEFVDGDPLSKALIEAWNYLERGALLPAAKVLEDELFIIDDMGSYEDNSQVLFRHFSSYTERALFNHLFADPVKDVVLVPRAYFEAHVFLSRVLLELNRPDDALAHARRAKQIDPLSTHARLSVVRCLEKHGDDEACMEELKELLKIAYDPEGVAAAYYRMAFFQLKREKRQLAEACYRKSMEFASRIFPIAAMELMALLTPDPTNPMAPTTINNLLRAEAIPIAPTRRIGGLLRISARAAMDAEIFPAARDLANILGAFSSDDVLVGIIRSMEQEPDR